MQMQTSICFQAANVALSVGNRLNTAMGTPQFAGGKKLPYHYLILSRIYIIGMFKTKGSFSSSTTENKRSSDT